MKHASTRGKDWTEAGREQERELNDMEAHVRALTLDGSIDRLEARRMLVELDAKIEPLEAERDRFALMLAIDEGNASREFREQLRLLIAAGRDHDGALAALLRIQK